MAETASNPDIPSADAAKAEQHQRARDAGWTETSAFDYEAFQRNGGDDGTFYGEGKVYEWSGEYGEVGPEVPELEKVLFGSDLITREGVHRANIEIQVALEGPTKVAKIDSFDDAGLHPIMLDNVKRCGYKTPTPIQAYTIPAVQMGHDVVGIAQTGSGKTAAYMIPVISKLMGKAKKLCGPKPDVTTGLYDHRMNHVRAEPLVVIVVPTRELAIQIFDEARRMCYRSMLRPCVAYGGLPMNICIEELGKGCDVLIGTPGRLCDLMDKPDILTMARVKFTIVDEADEMVDQDWEDELNKIMGGGDTNEDADHIYMLFSATFPKGARELARSYMAQDYLRIRVGRPGQSHKNIRQNVVYVDQDNKREALYDLLFASEPARTLIFCNSKPAVDLLDDFLYNRGLPTTSIHGDRNQREREDAIRAFRTGRAPILIATGISSRGWDVKDVKHVINYDLPSQMYGGITEYVHRIGRTARIGNQGLATSFYNDRNEDLAQDLVNILVECDCEVPDFLQHLVPEGGVDEIQWDDNSDDEAEAGDGGDGAWGDAAPDTDGGAPVADGFGGADGGFQAADDGFKTDGGDAGASAW
ncbi:ATP-dependent RNA helicase DED1 [Fulvia fulva]|uniref:RNA helicase n=1 Tax=Passalora fulva TaxID=5499 RepID=A0A9Q8UWI8_PASFU|nr:ATP-dependent RNA helicase DED1 [Fulvia fulva]KAK4608991.1 ATP-dependent RNA helicase DED1 [Fulvia fulva]KAK4609740.1 ATP-dependent RNA helicase DED1 [Fulvia fulva]UJO25061.1 ATP-dependent RNA helicase DED1 [Fulvia fulva]WPV22507.1 ATP-dependent RNA helicase DED1 [Fulvia fulva]WPV37861.1 ATP-dependent RNA helicase DED1 [Fulvia fulva]